MALSDFEANRNAVLGIKTGSTTPISSNASNSSFLQNRASVLSSPAPAVNIPTKTTTTQPVQQANVFNNIFNTIKSWFTIPKTELNNKLNQVQPIKIDTNKVNITGDLNKINLPQVKDTQTQANLTQKAQDEQYIRSKTLENIGNSLIETFPQTAESIKSLIKDPLSLKADPKKILSDAWSALKDPFDEAIKRYKLSLETNKNTPTSEVIARSLSNMSGTAGVILSPINALFSMANDVPVVSSFFKLVSIPFLTIGEAARKDSDMLIDQLPLSTQDKENLKPEVAEVFSLAAQIALGKVMQGPTKKAKETIKKFGVDNFEKLTKNMIDESGLPKSLRLTADQVKDIYQTGKLTTAEQADLYSSLNLSGKEIKTAMKNGLSVDIPAEKIIRVVDKPYWSKIKGIFGKSSVDKVISEKGDLKIDKFGGYLTEKAGEVVTFTPDEALSRVMESNIQNTPEGKLIISKANEARVKNKSIQIKSSDNPEATLKSNEGNIEINIVDNKPTKLTSKEKKVTIVYSGKPVGGELTKNEFFTTSKEVAQKYADLNKNVTGESEVVEKNVSDLKLKEVSQKEMLDVLEDKKIRKDYDGIIFKNTNTNDVNIALFNRNFDEYVKSSAEVAKLKRSAFSSNELKTIGRIKQLKSIDKYAAGDVETYRKTLGSNLDDLIETIRTLENQPEMSDSDALEMAFEVPSKKMTSPSAYGYIPKEEQIKKYPRTLNLQNKDDIEYLKRVFNDDVVENMKKGIFKYGREEGKDYIEEILKHNIIDESVKTPEEIVKESAKPYKLDSNKLFHGTSAVNTQIILKNGFRRGSDLPKDAFRSGGYGELGQKSISFSTDPKIASNFTGDAREGVLFTVSLNPNANIVTMKGFSYAEDLNDLVSALKKQKIDAVYLPNEKEVVVLNKSIIKIDSYKEFRVINRNEELSSIFKSKKSKSSSQLGFKPKNLSDPQSPKATKELNKIIKQSEIAKNLSEKLNIPIRRGKFRMAGAIGVYKHDQKVVRIKSGGLQVVFHEVAHFLDDTLNLSDSLNIKERQALMSEYANKYEGNPVKQRAEGFAEYMRFKLTGQQEKIDKFAPEFDKLFEENIKKYPEVKEVLDIAKADYQRWLDQPAVAKILGQINIGSENKMSLKDRVVNTTHDLYTIGLDDLHPLSEFVALGEKLLGNIPAEDNPYILARNLRGWAGKADLFLNKGTFDKQFWTKDEKGRYKLDYKTKGYKQIMKPIEEKGLLDEFRVFIVAERIVNDLAPRNIKTGISVEDAKTALKELTEKYPEFVEVSKERRTYKDQLLEYGAQNGLIGPKGLTKIKELNKYHVPFYRVMEETTTKFLGKSKIGGNLSSPVKKIKGSEREIIDPLESDVKDTYAIINAAERNNIGVAMAHLAKRNFELGRLFEKVVKPMTPVKVNAKEVLDKIMKQAGGDDIQLPDELADLAVTLFRPGQDRGPNMLNVNFGDKQEVYQVDPDLFKAIQGLNAEDLGMIIRILSFPAKLLRSGATLTPDFTVRNPIRDQFSAFVYSKYKFIPGVDLVKGVFELFKAGDVYDLWKAGGGESSMMVSLDREVLQKGFKQLMQSKGQASLEYVKNPLKLLQVVSEYGEAGTRLGEMRQALRAGDNPIAGAFASREITLDFARIGAKTKAINSITAFWNANLQGTDKMIRSFKTKPFKTLFKTLIGITLPSILLYLANRDDDRWKEIPSWQKDLFWIVMTDKHIYRIPKPFELGVIFGSVPERILEVIDSKDPKKLDELKKAVVDGFTPGFLPTALIPIIENITNYSFFTNRPIVSRGQEALPPEAQAGTYTSETAKLIGEALNYSPSKVDNLIQGYTGGLGKYSINILDKILEGTGITPPDISPANNFEDTPVLKAFMIRNPVGTNSESVNQVYDMYGKITPELNYVKKLIKLGETDKAKLYIQKHPEVANAPLVNAVVNSYSEMNKTIDQIRRSKDIDAVQKRDKINQIGQLQTTIAQKLLKSLKDQSE